MTAEDRIDVDSRSWPVAGYAAGYWAPKRRHSGMGRCWLARTPVSISERWTPKGLCERYISRDSGRNNGYPDHRLLSRPELGPDNRAAWSVKSISAGQGISIPIIAMGRRWPG